MEVSLLRSLATAYVESGSTIAKGPLQKCTTRLYARHRPAGKSHCLDQCRF
jgi:hypothetical protein